MSHVIISAAVVQAQCERNLEKFERLRAARMGREVYEEAHKKRWFGQPWGYERAFAALSAEGYDGEFFRISLMFGAQENKCQALLSLAKHGDPVYVSDDAAWILEKV